MFWEDRVIGFVVRREWDVGCLLEPSNKSVTRTQFGSYGLV